MWSGPNNSKRRDNNKSGQPRPNDGVASDGRANLGRALLRRGDPRQRGIRRLPRPPRVGKRASSGGEEEDELLAQPPELDDTETLRLGIISLELEDMGRASSQRARAAAPCNTTDDSITRACTCTCPSAIAIGPCWSTSTRSSRWRPLPQTLDMAFIYFLCHLFLSFAM
jgi:hypothetical protein